jgi:hypothetical protein
LHEFKRVLRLLTAAKTVNTATIHKNAEFLAPVLEAAKNLFPISRAKARQGENG